MNSHQLSLYAQDLHKLKPYQTSLGRWDLGMKSHPWLRSCWQSIVAGRRESVFFKGTVPYGLIALRYRPHTQEYMGSTNCTSWVLKRKDKNMSGQGRRGGDRSGSRSVWLGSKYIEWNSHWTYKNKKRNYKQFRRVLKPGVMVHTCILYLHGKLLLPLLSRDPTFFSEFLT